MNCRHCKSQLDHLVLDLGTSPPSNAYVSKHNLDNPEVYFPLRVYTCTNCWLVQTEDYSESESLFTEDYAYFSSTSKNWLTHAKQYCEMITNQIGLNSESFVIELASNDGYLLKNFVEKNIPCLGIEPTASTAIAAERIGVPTLQKFFGVDLANQLAQNGKQADLILGNNVYAHVPDINDFTAGIKIALNVSGTVTLEFPHLLQLMTHGQFDTVYHEHYSYLSLSVVNRIFKSTGLRVYDVEEIATHGGSLRVYGCHDEDARQSTKSVQAMIERELEFGLETTALFDGFQAKSENTKYELLKFLIEQKQNGKTVVAYGAAAKGNTLLNFAGIGPDLLTYVCDAAHAKQGQYLPGSRIPIYPPEKLDELRSDYVLILPWNIADEVIKQLSHLKEQGTQFLVAVPQVRIL